MRAKSCLQWRAKQSRWRVLIISRCRRYENHFSVKRYGSREKARHAALQWRDQVHNNLPRRRVALKHSRNRSGKVGVALQCKTNPSGEKYWSWVAHWRQDGYNCTRKFSVLKYGNAVAFGLAVKAREKGIACEPNNGENDRSQRAARSNSKRA